MTSPDAYRRRPLLLVTYEVRLASEAEGPDKRDVLLLLIDLAFIDLMNENHPVTLEPDHDLWTHPH